MTAIATGVFDSERLGREHALPLGLGHRRALGSSTQHPLAPAAPAAAAAAAVSAAIIIISEAFRNCSS